MFIFLFSIAETIYFDQFCYRFLTDAIFPSSPQPRQPKINSVSHTPLGNHSRAVGESRQQLWGRSAGQWQALWPVWCNWPHKMNFVSEREDTGVTMPLFIDSLSQLQKGDKGPGFCLWEIDLFWVHTVDARECPLWLKTAIWTESDKVGHRVRPKWQIWNVSAWPAA